MRILQLISTIGYYGAESIVCTLARQLHAQGHEVVVCILTRASRYDDSIVAKCRQEGVPALAIDGPGRLDLRAVNRLRRLVREREIDVVHTHNYKSNLYAWLATRSAGIPLVATCHNWTRSTASLRFYASLDRLILRGFRRTVAVSPLVADKLRQARIPHQRVSVIRNGIDTEVLQAAPAFPREHPAQVTIGCVCRLVHEKGVADLLHAAQSLLKERPGLRFLIAGDGPDRAEFEALAAELGIAPKVSFLGFQSNMAAVYASIDIFTLPSYNEGLPVSVLEAMAAGKPIVASRIGALPEVVTEAAGSLIPAGDRAALAHSLRNLIDNPALMRKQGVHARERVRQLFDARAMARQYVEVYEDALGPARGSRQAAGDPQTSRGTL
ncbi:MAG TPA: glycosyltransferase family 4 protein [Candidatus Saccharimonadales bacterium]|jgi:glycosyltransferase involved in cell wall biosynthesis|nr:glycosyltransferase family 4 protein [Candidatus Saccharimonadales bacterium]